NAESAISATIAVLVIQNALSNTGAMMFRSRDWVAVTYGGAAPGDQAPRRALPRSLRIACKRMMRQHQIAQPRLEHMGIDFRRGKVGMAKQHLDRAQIGPVFKQMGRKGMAQAVRRDARGCNPGHDRKFLDQQIES